jgi:hypothetical protein
LNPSAIAADANPAAQHGTASIGLNGERDCRHQRQKKCDHEACQENIENATGLGAADIPDGGHSVPDSDWFVPGAWSDKVLKNALNALPMEMYY